MNALIIKETIRKLKENGETSYENCEKLICLEQALKCLCKDDDDAQGRSGTGHFEDKEACHSLSWKDAEKWVSKMKNSDGTCGKHWSMEQVQQVMDKRGLNCFEPAQFYAVLNAVHSDYYAVAKKHNVDTAEFYIDLAIAWLEDEDAVKDKAMKYFEYIVKH